MFLGEEGSLPHRGTSYCSPRKLSIAIEQAIKVLWKAKVYISSSLYANNIKIAKQTIHRIIASE